MQASTIGTKQQIDLPEPVPVVTTRLCWFRATLMASSLVAVEGEGLAVAAEDLGGFGKDDALGGTLVGA